MRGLRPNGRRLGTFGRRIRGFYRRASGSNRVVSLVKPEEPDVDSSENEDTFGPWFRNLLCCVKRSEDSEDDDDSVVR